MPTYVYRCDTCGHQFELSQRMSDDPIDICPECQSAVRRVIHPVGIVFKGSGWYITDNRAKDTSETGAGESQAETSGNGTGDKSDNNQNGSSESNTKPDSDAKSESSKTTADQGQGSTGR